MEGWSKEKEKLIKESGGSPIFTDAEAEKDEATKPKASFWRILHRFRGRPVG